MSPKGILIGVIGSIVLAVAAYFFGVDVTNTKWKAKTEEAINKAVEKALTEERAMQDVADKIVQEQVDNLGAVNKRLSADLKRLQQRENRRREPKDTKTECQGASGAELSREDAEFLAREAARADGYAVALASCYAYADSLQTD